MSIEQRICFAGAGSMAEAIIRGLVSTGVAMPDRIYVTNQSNEDRLLSLRDRYAIRIPEAPEEKASFVSGANAIVLAMKPKDAPEALRSLSQLLRPEQLIISVIAGMSIATLQTLLGRKLPIARTMPNTPSTIGLGAAGVSFSAEVQPEQRQLVMQIFSAVGEVSVVAEPLLDIVTGVSGSGPAYVYYLIEQMIAAGVQGGLSPEIARELSVQTVLGAAQMVKTTGEDPAELRRKVTSPNGTTQAALATLDRGGFPETMRSAVLRAAQRAQELGTDIARSARDE